MNLSPREAEILSHLAAGEVNREIAESLSISARTVERYVANVYAKIGVTNRVEATAFAIRSGLA